MGVSSHGRFEKGLSVFALHIGSGDRNTLPWRPIVANAVLIATSP
jgi:hypothetical protein